VAFLGSALLCSLGVGVGQAGALDNKTSSLESAQLSADVLALLFPRNGSDFASGFGVQNFFQSVDLAAEGRCMTAAGFRPPPAPIQGSEVNNTQFPDLSRIAKFGFVNLSAVYGPPSATQGMSKAETHAYNATFNKCAASTPNENTLLNEAKAIPLENEWEDILEKVDTSSLFIHALRGFVACSASAGVDIAGFIHRPESGPVGVHNAGVASIDAFFDDMARQIQPLTNANARSEAQAESIHLGGIYARCLGPAEAVRDRLREVDRVEFFSEHAEQILQIQKIANDMVNHLASEYGVRETT
jgi:hypothetical protein